MESNDITETENNTIWPSVMTRAGDRADFLQMEEAWNLWLKKEPEQLTYSNLAWSLVQVCMSASEPIHIYAYNRVADAMLQIARKEGVIETVPGTKAWRLTERTSK